MPGHYRESSEEAIIERLAFHQRGHYREVPLLLKLLLCAGLLQNVSNVAKSSMFCDEVDKATGFKTRNILCFPIQVNNKLMGVAQLCNKIGGQ